MDRTFPSLIAVTHEMVRNAPQTARAISDKVGYKKYQTFMSEISGQPGHKLGADMLLPLMEQCECDSPLQFLARQRGGVFIRMPEPMQEGAGGACLVQTLSISIKEFGDFVTVSAADVADGVVSREEHERIVSEGFEALTAIMTMIHMVTATAHATHGVTVCQ